MDNENIKEIDNGCHSDSHVDSPKDGIRMDTKCVRTDFNMDQKEGELPFTQKGIADCHISASYELGTFSIRDMETGVMLSVHINDAMEVLASAMEAARAVERTEQT